MALRSHMQCIILIAKHCRYMLLSRWSDSVVIVCVWGNDGTHFDALQDLRARVNTLESSICAMK